MAKDMSKSLIGIQEKMSEIGEQLHKIDKDAAIQQSSFLEHLRMHERMYEEFKNTNEILKINTESLREHMHRTELLEQVVSRMESRLTPVEEAYIASEAVKKYKHEKLVRWSKIVAAIVGLVGIIVALKSFIIKLLLN